MQRVLTKRFYVYDLATRLMSRYDTKSERSIAEILIWKNCYVLPTWILLIRFYFKLQYVTYYV